MATASQAESATMRIPFEIWADILDTALYNTELFEPSIPSRNDATIEATPI